MRRLFEFQRLVMGTLSVSLWSLLPAVACGVYALAAECAQSEQYKIAAKQALTGPFRVDVEPAQQGVKPGSPATLKLVLRNADNETVNATERMTLEVTATSPSREKQKQTIELAPGASSGEVTLSPKEAGLWKLDVRESNNHIKNGSNYLLVSQPTQQSPHSKKGSKRSRPVAKPPDGAFVFLPRLVLAAYTPPYDPPQDPPSGSGQQPAADSGILLAVSGEGGGQVRADGVSAARVTVFLTSPQTTDVHVWLAVNQGQLSAPMLTIRAGDVSGELKWTSTTVGQGKVSVNNARPRIAGQDEASATVEFVDPIVAIAFVQPISKINIVELGTIAVRFVDRNANPVTPHASFPYSFRANSTHVRLKPESDQTKPGDIDFSTSVSPTAFGNITIEAAVPGYQPIQQSIEVRGLLLLFLCALGGALGGLVKYFDRNREKGLTASVVSGMVVGLPATWLYVWVGLPNISTTILHNQLSAFMVAIIAGVLGSGSLKFAAQKAGFGLFGPADGKASGAPA